MNHAPRFLSSKIGKSALTLFCSAAAGAILLGSTCNLANRAPSVPVISGPSAGVVGVAVTFEATATDPDGDSVGLRFDWGDSSLMPWSGLVASGHTLPVTHTYSDTGTYLIRVAARDRNNKESGWCMAESIHISSMVRDYPDSVYAEIAITGGGWAGAMTPDGKLLYVAHGDDSRKVTPIRLADRAALPSITFDVDPTDIISSVDGSHMYVTLQGADKVAAIRTSDNTVDFTVSVPHMPREMAVTPDGQFLMVSVYDPDRIMFLRAADLTVADSVNVTAPSHILIDPAGERAYLRARGGVRILDLTTHLVVDSLTSIANPQEMGLSRDGLFLYVANLDDSGFAVIRLSDRAVVAHVQAHIIEVRSFANTPSDDYVMFSYYRGVFYAETRAYAIVDSLVNPAESRRALVMHPTADTMYMIGWNKVYIIGPK